MRLALAFGFWLLASCGNRDRPKVEETEHHKSVVDPPAKEVRALPPHAIRADGVGPYKLGASLSDLNDLLRSGPHIAQIDIPNVIRVSVLRAEDETVLIGGQMAGEQGKATFVAVIDGQVARTESGIHVGSPRGDLGAPQLALDRARDPHIAVPAAMPELRALLDGDRVAGLVVVPREPAAKDAAPDACVRPTVVGDDLHRFGACLSGAGDVVVTDGDEIAIRAQDDKSLATLPIHNLVFAAALRAPDGRDELYVVTRIVDDAASLTWVVAGYRLEGTHLVRVVDPMPAYQLTAANARWIGADLRDLDLYLELAVHGDGIEVGGLLTTRVGGKLRDLLVLAPVQVPRRHPKSPTMDGSDARIPDAPLLGSGSGSDAHP